ncbi:MAG: flagellar hook-associated protein FlgL [Gemmatimonadetes bacterium]|nr:flagellar hook-associated protein FlgL [Gemmatimonadota bacterium]
MTRSAIERIQRTMAKVERAQDQIATGLRVQRPSDDPIAADRILEVSSELQATTQYMRNIERGLLRVQTEEQALDGLTDLLARAREIAAQQGSSTAGATSHAIAAEEVAGLVESAIALGNTRFGDTYLFGGAYATTAPFADDGSTSPTAPPVGSHLLEIDNGRTAESNHDGQTVFVDTRAISLLQDLEAALISGDSSAIGAAIVPFETALDDVQELIGEIGVRAQSFEAVRNAHEERELDLLEVRSEARDVDLDRAVTELLAHQAALEAALLAISRTDTTSLLDRI